MSLNIVPKPLSKPMRAQFTEVYASPGLNELIIDVVEALEVPHRVPLMRQQTRPSLVQITGALGTDFS